MDLLPLLIPVVVLIPFLPFILLTLIPIDIVTSVTFHGGAARTSISASFGAVACRLVPGEETCDIFLNGREIMRFDLRIPKKVTKTRLPPGKPPEREGFEPSVIPPVIRAAIRFLRLFSLRSLTLDLTFGTGNPFDTGLIFGAWAALRPFIHDPPARSLAITPVFDRQAFEGSLAAEIRLQRPVLLVGAALKSFADPGFRKALTVLGGTR